MKHVIQAAGKTVDVFAAGETAAPLVVLNTFQGEGEAVYEAVQRLTGRRFTLAAISGLDWNAELSPWPAPPVFTGALPFGGEADAYLDTLTGAILPEILKTLPTAPALCALAGYSMAGLFALYALYRTDRFARVASASGSLWYPGFLEFALNSAMAAEPEGIFLSLGDREAKTRKPAMRTVEAHTERLARHLAGLGIPTRFEFNPGGHFQDPTGRMARAIAWAIA